MSKFTYISEILVHKRFKKFLNHTIEEETHRRNNRLVVYDAQGKELKRTGTDRKSNPFISIEERGCMTVEWLTDQFELIEARKSQLTAGERAYVCRAVDGAIMKTIEYYKVTRIIRIKNSIFKRIKNLFKWL